MRRLAATGCVIGITANAWVLAGPAAAALAAFTLAYIGLAIGEILMAKATP